MKPQRFAILRRFTFLIFGLITVLGLLFIVITYFATTTYHQATTQLLNKDVAKHVAEFTASFTAAGINKRKADSVFKNAMVMNPNAEVYFLDSAGGVIYFEAAEVDIRQRRVDLAPIGEYLATGGEEYVKGTDPKEPGTPKIFSVAEVGSQNRQRGYIYVVLGSEKSKGITELLFGSHILGLAIKVFVVVILLSLVFSFFYLRRVRKNFQRTMNVLERFENGDYTARFTERRNDGLAPVTHAFNKMADLLSSAINGLTQSEEERKNFIATISHDLRTPLAIARGYTETALMKKEGYTPEEQKAFSSLIHEKLLQIENRVKQLFELSKMDAVEFRPQLEPLVLSEIVQETMNAFEVLATGKGVALKCTPCVHHVWVKADVGMIERVVQNLVDNAVKNTPPGGCVHAMLLAENGEHTFTLENNGPPLTDGVLRWITGFGEGKASLKERPQKSGLGLLIVQRILHLHNASLTARVHNGKNLFGFTLPVYTPNS